MFTTLKALLKDERGSQFIENGLWIGLVVLSLAVAGMTLAGKIGGKYDVIGQKIDAVNIPDIVPPKQ